jgi:invasion protein IalB
MRSRASLALASLLLAAPALAQAPAPAPAAPAAEAAAADRPADRPWTVSCTEAAAGAPRDCRLVAAAILQPQNQRLLTAILLRQPETRSLALVFQVPHGAAIPAGLAWQLDESEPQRLAYQASDAEGLYVGVPVADDLLGMLRRGGTLRVSFAVAGRREPLTVSLPLARFAEASTEFFAAERR